MSFGTLVSKVSGVSTLKAGDLIQRLEPAGVTVSSAHRMHPVVGLSVRHERLPRLVALLVLQLLGHLVAVTDLGEDDIKRSPIVSCND